MNLKTMKSLFIVAALYDIVLGVLFLFAFKQVYAYCQIALPNHDGYIQFAALLVTIFGVGFWFVAQNPQRNRDIIKMGILLKAAYSGTVLWYWAIGNIPFVWVPFAGFDLVFLGLFVAALRAVPREKE